MPVPLMLALSLHPEVQALKLLLVPWPWQYHSKSCWSQLYSSSHHSLVQNCFKFAVCNQRWTALSRKSCNRPTWE